MKLKQYVQFDVDLKGRWLEAAAAMMGVSVFMRLLYYFAVTNLRDTGAVELIFSMAFGLLIAASFIVCAVCLRLNAPGLYGIIGAAACLAHIILGFSSGDVLRIILTVLWYLFAAVVLLATTGGYLPGRLLAAIVFGIGLLVRVLFYDFGTLGLVDWVREIPILCVIAAFGCLAMGLKPRKKQ